MTQCKQELQDLKRNHQILTKDNKNCESIIKISEIKRINTEKFVHI